jgi:hypothetical protein
VKRSALTSVTDTPMFSDLSAGEHQKKAGEKAERGKSRIVLCELLYERERSGL